MEEFEGRTNEKEGQRACETSWRHDKCDTFIKPSSIYCSTGVLGGIAGYESEQIGKNCLGRDWHVLLSTMDFVLYEMWCHLRLSKGLTTFIF